MDQVIYKCAASRHGFQSGYEKIINTSLLQRIGLFGFIIIWHVHAINISMWVKQMSQSIN